MSTPNYKTNGNIFQIKDNPQKLNVCVAHYLDLWAKLCTEVYI